VLHFTDDSKHLADSTATTSSREILSPITGATIAISMSADGKKVAASTLGASASVVYFDDLTTKTMDRKILTVDGEAYPWVQLIEGAPTRVVAGSRSGNVRVWDVSTRELLATFSVPAGPGGAGYAVIGDDVVTVAIGQPGIHRWKLSDGSLVASFEAEATPVDAAARAARLDQERSFAAARESLIAAIDTSDDAVRLQLIEKMRGPQAKLIEGLGMAEMIDNWFAGIRINQITELGKSKRALEAFELGYKEISTGVLHPYLVYITLFVGNRVYGKDATPEFRKRALAIGERAIALYPTDVSIHGEYRRARIDAFQREGKIADAMKEVDELDIVDATKAPHASERYNIQMYAYDFADKAGRKRDAMNALIEAMDYTSKPDDRLMLANNIFALSYALQEWKLALNSANMVLQMDEKMKNDQSFMAAARYAYQMANPK
jgi:tetratricopeptide (TPR) repeat protein